MVQANRVKEFKKQQKTHSRQKMYEKLLAKAEFRSSISSFTDMTLPVEHRKLEDANGAGDDAVDAVDDGVDNGADDAVDDGNAGDDGVEDEADGDDGDDNDDQQEEEDEEDEEEEEEEEEEEDDFDDALQDNGNFEFNALKYSLKYIRCQGIETFSDQMAEDEESDSVLLTKRFVVFRLCNSQYCSNDNSFGCNYDYGEYIMELADYLDVMKEYIEERNEAYCDFCKECMEMENGDRRRLEDAGADDAAGNDAGDDAANNEADDGIDEEEQEEENEDEEEDENEADDVVQGDDANVEHACEYYDVCYNYEDTCEAEQDDGFIEYSDFFECQMYEGRNGDAMYIAPHCGSDGHTIMLGLYYDEYCSQYAGYDQDINDYTGLNFAEDGLEAYYTTDCISCKESVSLSYF